MNASITILTFVLATIGSTLAAQQTWIVDENGGVGSSFTGLGAAVRTARNGDTIIVRSGIYAAPTVTTGIKLIGEPGAELDTLTSRLEVHDLPSDQTFVMAGFTTLSGYATRIRFINNRGKIIIEDLKMIDPPGGIDRTPGASIVDSDFVSLNRCRIFGTPGMSITRSHVIITDCTVGGTSKGRGIEIGHALIATDSKIECSQPSFYGADDPIGPTAAAAIVIRGGWLNLAGDSAAYVSGGSANSSYRLPAIVADDCTVRYDTDIQLNTQSPMSQALVGTATFIPESMIALSATGKTSASQELTVTVRGPAFAPAILLISLTHTPIATSFGTLWLDVDSSFILASDFIDANGHWSMSYSVPANLPGGLTSTLQAFVDDGIRLSLSQPTSIVTH